MTRTGLDIIEAAKQDGSWNRLDDIEGEPVVPEDLGNALVENDAAEKCFYSLAPSQKKIPVVAQEREKAGNKRE